MCIPWLYSQNARSQKISPLVTASRNVREGACLCNSLFAKSDYVNGGPLLRVHIDLILSRNHGTGYFTQ